jgi:chloramphenicol-sensitive protein RarD
MENTHKDNKNYVIGTMYALGAFIAWGLLPAFWKLLKHVPTGEILAHRILWAFVFVTLLLFAKGQLSGYKSFWHSRENRFSIILSAILINLNWGTYIWAVNTNQIIQTSLGYYITPLFSVFLGLVVLRERMNFWQYVAVALAACGVLILTVRFGRVPWIGLVLTLTFGLYGLLKKTMKLDSLTGLSIETMLMSPFCLGFIAMKGVQNTGSFSLSSISTSILLIIAGVVTAVPLFWFAQAAKRIPLSRLGFFQYLAPTLALLLGVFVYHEQFTRTHLISFGCIWTALALYSFSETTFMKNKQPAWTVKVEL